MEYPTYSQSVRGLLIPDQCLVDFGATGQLSIRGLKKDVGMWLRLGTSFMDNEEPFGSIPEIAGDLRDVDILTVLSKGDEPMDYFGRIMDEGGIEAMPVDNEDDGFLGVVQLQPEQDLRHGGDLRPEEVQGETTRGRRT